jgi:hypothetical protein
MALNEHNMKFIEHALLIKSGRLLAHVFCTNDTEIAVRFLPYCYFSPMGVRTPFVENGRIWKNNRKGFFFTAVRADRRAHPNPSGRAKKFNTIRILPIPFCCDIVNRGLFLSRR